MMRVLRVFNRQNNDSLPEWAENLRRWFSSVLFDETLAKGSQATVQSLVRYSFIPRYALCFRRAFEPEIIWPFTFPLSIASRSAWSPDSIANQFENRLSYSKEPFQCKAELLPRKSNTPITTRSAIRRSEWTCLVLSTFSICSGLSCSLFICCIAALRLYFVWLRLKYFRNLLGWMKFRKCSNYEDHRLNTRALETPRSRPQKCSHKSF